MAERKTYPTKLSVTDFLKALPDPGIRNDSRTLARIMHAATGARAVLWGGGLVGFGVHRRVESNGHIAEWMIIAFAPRRTRITIYIMDGLAHHGSLLAKLGPHSIGSSCLHIRRLSEVRLPVLTKIIAASVENRKRSSVKRQAPSMRKKASPQRKAKAAAKKPRA